MELSGVIKQHVILTNTFRMDDVLSCTEIKAIRNLEYHPNVVKIVDVV